ncbi:MAG: efflux RND transporter permease subunit [Prevotellaceae bacterium]|nr:efflux RND transporter permease subunit [Prevotellaceae bacterium]
MENTKRNFVEWAMHYRQIVIMVTCCLVAFGIYALADMNKNEFPDFTVRQGVVVAVYPGASSQEIEEQVTKPLEKYIFSYKEVKKEKTKSYSRNGMSIIQVELNDDISGEAKDNFWSKFKHGITGFKAQLPTGVLALQVQDDFGDTSALLITMESKDKTYRELNDYMDELEDQLRKIESVGRMNIYGMQKEQISIYLDSEKMSHYGIGPNMIAMQLFTKGFVTTAGTNKSEGYDSPIQVERSLNMEADVENMIVYSSPDGNVVRLKDIAAIKREYPKPSSFITNNGTKCLLLSVEIKKGRSITAMGEEIQKALETFQKTMPDDVNMFTITNQAKVVSDSVVTFLHELLIAIVAVVIVVLLLMPMRVALVAASTIPISIFISLGLFYAFGIELNTVTLAALIVTLGMIVDNSIVIIDSYVEMLAEGHSRWHASIASATHFFKSIFSATLAISITFFPFLLTMTGMFHDFLLYFPWAITIVLAISLLVAELIVPFLQFYFIRKPLKNELPENGKKKFSFLDLMQKYYDKLLAVCFKHPYMTISAGVLSAVIGGIMFGILPQKMMPTAERNQFAVEIYLPTGSSVERTAAIADSLEHMIRKDTTRIVSVASFKGTSSPRFHTSYAPQFAGTNYAQFVVNTTGNEATLEVLKECRMKYATYFPGAYVRFKQMAYSQDANPVEVRISGEDWEKLKKTADSLTTIFRANPDLMLARNDINEPLLTTDVKLDEVKAGRLGITNAMLESTLAMRYNSTGIALGTVWDGDYGVNVCLKSNNADRSTAEDVADELIPVNGGLRNVPLRQVATVRPVWQDGQISHRNGVRTITVMADVVDGRNVMAVTAEMQKSITQASMPDGISLEWGGEYYEAGQSTPQIISALMISVVIIFFILVWHFRRIGTAVLLLLSLSMTLFGTAMGVLISGVNFGLTCFLGIISLMGILVRNAIIMYDYAEELRETEKMTAHDAIYTSARRRMRPIFLTSAAASMGVIPMILGGSGLWMPMGAVICYGTIITMFLILTVLPVAYWLMMSGSTKRRERSNELEKQ